MRILFTSTTSPDSNFAAMIAEYGSLHLCLRGQPLTPADLQALAEAETLLAHPRYFTRLDTSWLQKMPRLRLIMAMSTGVDWIDLPAVAARQIQLQAAQGASAPSVAEFSWMLALVMTKKMPGLSTPSRQTGLTRGIATELWQKNVGIVGYGQVGQQIGRIAHGFGMEVCYTDYRQRHYPGGRLTPLAELCQRSHLIFLALPLQAETRLTIGAPELALMSAQTYLINPARPELVDTAAVVTALSNGRLAGYAVDGEQLDHPQVPNLMNQGLIVHTPHLAYQSVETRQRIQEATLAALRSFSQESRG